jgi:hypothetical protein
LRRWLRRVDSGGRRDGHDAAEIENPANCVPGGHDCWARAFEADPVPVRGDESPLSLHESADFLGAVWYAVFKHRLFVPKTITPAAKLASQCTDRVDFEAKCSAVGEVLNSMTVPDGLLVPEHVGDTAHKPGLALARLESAVHHRIKTSGGEASDVERLSESIRWLRKALRIRAGAQHGAAADELPGIYRHFGIAFPPSSWTDAWAVLRSRVARELSAIREIVARLEEQ